MRTCSGEEQQLASQHRLSSRFMSAPGSTACGCPLRTFLSTQLGQTPGHPGVDQDGVVNGWHQQTQSPTEGAVCLCVRHHCVRSPVCRLCLPLSRMTAFPDSELQTCSPVLKGYVTSQRVEILKQLSNTHLIPRISILQNGVFLGLQLAGLTLS